MQNKPPLPSPPPKKEIKWVEIRLEGDERAIYLLSMKFQYNKNKYKKFKTNLQNKFHHLMPVRLVTSSFPWKLITDVHVLYKNKTSHSYPYYSDQKFIFFIIFKYEKAFC